MRGETSFILLLFKESEYTLLRLGAWEQFAAYIVQNSIVNRGRPHCPNHITLQTYHKLAIGHPNELLKMVNATPVTERRDTITWVMILSRLLG